MNIFVELTEEEAVIVETLLNEAAIELQDELFWADEAQDWDAYDELEVEYEFFMELADDISIQMYNAEEVLV